MAKNFRLVFSPLFYADLDKITDYILLELKNEAAAIKLINDVEVAVKQCCVNPLKVAVYESLKVRQQPYRRIIVGNYLIFYVVIHNTVVIRRMLYGRRNMDDILP